jgi:SHS2 domain-containing protein
MDELLFRFSADFFTVKEIKITSFTRSPYHIEANLKGETFSRTKHPIGTEIKAITYSNMQIHEKEDHVDIFIIVDI